MRETSAVLAIGGSNSGGPGGNGIYPVPNPFGGGLGCTLTVILFSTPNSASSAILDIDGRYSTNPAALPTNISTPMRGLILSNQQGNAVPTGPFDTQATDQVQLVVTAGSCWMTYQWSREIPDPEANAVQHAAQATLTLHKPGCKGGNSCHCHDGRVA